MTTGPAVCPMGWMVWDRDDNSKLRGVGSACCILVYCTYLVLCIVVHLKPVNSLANCHGSSPKCCNVTVLTKELRKARKTEVQKKLRGPM
jgi:hypothetical protein